MNKLQIFIESLPCGFLTEQDMPELIRLDRLHPVLVRCGTVRFTCGAQYLSAMLAMVEKAGDYVRDVSLPDGCLERAAYWTPDADLPLPPKYGPSKYVSTRPEDKGEIISKPFNEADCGGVFDGNQVWSDTELGGAPGF